MGTAQRRFERSLSPKPLLNPGDQIQVKVDLKTSIPKKCKCGSIYFLPVIAVHIVSPLMSPTGQELMAQVPVLICFECKTPLGMGNDDKKEE